MNAHSCNFSTGFLLLLLLEKVKESVEAVHGKTSLVVFVLLIDPAAPLYGVL